MKKMYLLAALVMTLTCTLAFTSPVSAAPDATVVVNGETLVAVVPPQNVNGRLLVPFSAIGNALSAEVVWDGAKKEATLVLDGKYVSVVIGSNELTRGEAGKDADGKFMAKTKSVSAIDVAAVIIEGYTMVPLSAMAEGLGADVKWDNATKTAMITLEQSAKEPMTASSSKVKNGKLDLAFGQNGSQKSNGVPTRSFPITIENAPKGTVCYAITMTDPDSVPLCGYEWTHWLAANITTAEIPENASIDQKDSMVQGANDFGGRTSYGGPTPPDKVHTYVITVYALDSELKLNNGFTKLQLESAMKGHILAEASFTAKY